MLPEGLRDDLPPFAEYEAAVLRGLLSRFAAQGYLEVTPPLVEFEESLFAGTGDAKTLPMFRVMDPASHRMMAIRADMTLQIARIATTRLSDYPRPLRLSYGGQVLQVKGSQLRPDRQFAQSGVELIGSKALEADIEVILLARDALSSVGVNDLSFDLVIPRLVPMVCNGLGLSLDDTLSVREALDAKDIGTLAAIDGAAGKILRGLLNGAGPAADALDILRALDLPAEVQGEIADLGKLVAGIQDRAPDLSLTIDPGEYHGFEYKTGIGFSLFARGVKGELGRGGRYVTSHGDGHMEPAVGFSVYLDSLIRALPKAVAADLVFIPSGTDFETVRALQRDGWRTVQALEPVARLEPEALRLGCSHIWDGRSAKSLK